MALVYLFFAIGFVSAPDPHHVDCNHDPQHCIQVALVTTDPKECEHIIHELHDCHSYVMIDLVCGTDQHTYPNKCELAKARCHTLKPDHGAHVLALAHEGSCSSTTQIHGIDPNLSAVEYLTCTLAIQQTCAPNNVEVICGSNGLTYYSL
ncbi:hypothetical protein DPMN_014825 [Dreissena polymorpha]|uniref:Kazal-like domain-containing protein n=2 Tax=Dreissena polymorpha TaxID=45954 RepID=A0A9D4N6Q3_DREPO|nr:hypothetical protein DPMN_014825 [Dreissena polymorpha]